MDVVRAVCVAFVLTFARAQAYLPCAAGTQWLTVSSTDNAATLASLLQCSSGSFNVEWFGNVVVSQTINVTQGTSPNVTGATTGATADGNNTAQLFAIDGASSLHLTDLILTNGHAEFGGAVNAMEQANVSFSGDTRFVSNTAWFGGAIYADSSTVVWDGEKTIFRENYALYYGGAIMAGGLSGVSWDGETVFVNNSANYTGGAAYLHEASIMSWSAKTLFVANTAERAGAVYANSSSVLWDGATTFINNYASSYGGAIMAEGSSSMSWDSVTHFTDNSAYYLGGAVLVHESSEVAWDSVTVFTANTAMGGGAIFADSSSVVWDGEGTTFISNYASSYGGAIMAEGSSSMSWDSVTHFTDNSAYSLGGAVLVHESSEVAWDSVTVFTANTAMGGGAIYADSSSVVWDGEGTTFISNYALYWGGAVMTRSVSSLSWDGETLFTSNTVGYAGGAVHAANNADVYWGGKSTFQNNSAYLGGAVMTETSSTVFWDGETVFIDNDAIYGGGAVNVSNGSYASWTGNTTFLNNFAYLGGAIVAATSSGVSWGGETVFKDNNATFFGGGLYVVDYSSVSWAGNTTFRNNSARDGGGLFMYQYCAGSWSGTTTFASNTAVVTGGGLNVHTYSNASWTGVTTFTSNFADRAGALWIWSSNVAWTGITMFLDNSAYTDGGAVYATTTHSIISQGTTTFQNNMATTGNGGALGLYGSLSSGGSYVNFTGETTFVNNSAFGSGGAIFSSCNPDGQHFEDVAFSLNTARVGGAVATFGTGNGDELVPSPAMFLRCQFISNKATETGGAVETAFGQEDIVSSYFEDNSADVGGAIRLAGETTVLDCSFVANIASNSGLAVAAVGSMEMSGSSFDGNVFSCDEGEYLEEVQKEGLGTARYGRVCSGCPSWEECNNCTVENINIDLTCSIALDHTTAAEAGSTLHTLSIGSGYWRASTESAKILECYNKEACLGGQTGTEHFCDDGYGGPYCSVCQSGYSSSMSTTCTRCSQSRRRGFVAITVFSAVIVVCAVAAFSKYLVSTNFEGRNATSIHHRIIQAVPLHTFKSVIVVWQILTQFASVANVTYPGVYQAFLSGIDVINLDPGLIISTGCLWSGIDFHDRLLASTIGPFVALGSLAVLYAVASHRNSRCDRAIREKIRNKHLSAMLLLVFLVYSSVSSVVFRMFACDSLDDGKEYLRADYRILCTDDKHRALQVYAAIMIVVYPVGIPLLYATLLYRHREVLSDARANKSTARPIAALWEPYRPNCFYYEVVECGRRILLTGVAVFIYPNDAAQIAITLMNTFFFFVVSEVLSPYESASDMWLSRGGHVIIYFSMFDALLLKVDVSEESSESQRVFAWVLVAGHAVMIVTIIVEAVGIYYAARRKGRVMEEDTPSQCALRSISGRSIGLDEVAMEEEVSQRRGLEEVAMEEETPQPHGVVEASGL